MLRIAATTIIIVLMAIVAHCTAAVLRISGPQVVPISAPAPATPATDALSPEEKMQRRYPQPVKVGDLIGLPVLDYDDRTLGRVKSVVRTASGKVQLIVPYGGFLGFRQRLVAVPIEVVAIAGRQLAALDMTRAEFDAAPAWRDPQSQPIPASEIIRIALYKR
jgi:PRC-barrel domain